MATIPGLLSDPEFRKLPEGEQLKGLREVDPDFGALPESEQRKALTDKSLQAKPLPGTELTGLPGVPEPANPIEAVPDDAPRRPMGEQLLKSPLSALDAIGKGMFQTVTGIGGAIEATGTLLDRPLPKRLLRPEPAEILKATGRGLQAAGKWGDGSEEKPRYSQSFLDDPTLLFQPDYILDLAGQAVGSSIGSMIPAVGVMGKANQALKAMQFTGKMAKIAEATIGAGAGAFLESLQDAGSSYVDAIEKEASPEIAAQVFTETMKREGATTWMTNLAGLFNPATKGAWKVVLSMAAEGGEEVAQGAAQRSAQNKVLGTDTPLLEGAEVEALGGALGGGVMGAGMSALDRRAGKTAPAAPEAVSAPVAPPTPLEVAQQKTKAKRAELAKQPAAADNSLFASEPGEDTPAAIAEVLADPEFQALPIAEQEKGIAELEAEAAPEAVSAPAAPPAPRAAPKLPQALAGAKPKYNYGLKSFALEFDSDIDRAAYIAAQKNPSKADAHYLKFAMESTGLSEAEVRAHGVKVRAAIKEQARDGEPGKLKVPELEWKAAAAIAEVLADPEFQALPIAEQEKGIAEIALEAEAAPEAVSAPATPPPAKDAFQESLERNNLEAPANEPKPGDVVQLKVKSISVDPARFQFKRNVGQGGAGEELRDVEKFDPEMAGVVMVWRDSADGKTYIVNGHHRLELAQRTGTEVITSRFIHAATAIEARTTGALVNIAEGRGDSVDAAKVFRDGKLSEADLKSRGVSIKGKLAAEGMALSKLDPHLFSKVVNGDIPAARAAVIGAGLPRHEDQRALYDLIEKRDKAGKRPTNAQIGEMIRITLAPPEEGGAPVVTETQTSLFGEEEVKRSLIAELAEVSDYVRAQLGAEKRLFAIAGDTTKAGKLAERGNVIKAADNQAVAEQAARAIEIYDRLSTRSGPVAEALARAASELAEGKNDGTKTKQAAYAAIRESLLAESDRLTGRKGSEGPDDRSVAGHGGKGPNQISGGEHDRAPAAEAELDDPDIIGPSFAKPQALTGFYSELERVIEAKMPASSTPAQVAGILKAGVKADELRETGIAEWLAAQGPKITKQAVLDYLTEQQIVIREVGRGGGDNSWPNPAFLAWRDKNFTLDPMTRLWRSVQMTGATYTAEQVFTAYIQEGNSDSLPTKYEGYTLAGEKKNYRELLLTLPAKAAPVTWTDQNVALGGGPRSLPWFQSSDGRADIYGTSDGRFQPYDIVGKSDIGGPVPTLEWAKERVEEHAAKTYGIAYQSGHWQEPNVLAHIRLDERAGPDGKPMLFVEEIQSDWHQAGRKRGYKGTPAEIAAAVEERRRTNDEYTAYRNKLLNTKHADTAAEVAESQRLYEIRSAASEAARRLEEGVPRAPYSKTWHELAFKRVLSYAVEHGYSEIAWTTGDQQNDRYDLSKRVGSIQYDRDGTFTAWEPGTDRYEEEDGNEIMHINLKPEQIEEYVGKEVAEKLLAQAPNTHGTRSLAGLELRMGGEGMKGFYDSILPKFVNAYTKKWGGRVGESAITMGGKEIAVGQALAILTPGSARDGSPVWIWQTRTGTELSPFFKTREQAIANLPHAENTRFGGGEKYYYTDDAERSIPELNGPNQTEPVHSLKITPAMRDGIAAGQPLYAKPGPLTPKPDPSKAQAVYRTPRGGRGGILYANADAIAIMGELEGTPFDGVNYPAAWAYGLAAKLQAYADGHAGATRAAVADLRAELLKAVEGKPSVAIATHPKGRSIAWTKATIRHEKMHGVQRVLSAGKYSKLMDPFKLLGDPLAKGPIQNLIAGGYRNNPNELALEIGAHLVAGPEHWARLGIPNTPEGEEHALKLWGLYLDALAEKNGEAALDMLNEIAPQLIEEVRSAKRRHQEAAARAIGPRAVSGQTQARPPGAQEQGGGPSLRDGSRDSARPDATDDDEGIARFSDGGGLFDEFDADAQREAEAAAAKKLEADQLTAEFNAPLKKKLKREKAPPQTNLFEETPEAPQGSLFEKSTFGKPRDDDDQGSLFSLAPKRPAYPIQRRQIHDIAKASGKFDITPAEVETLAKKLSGQSDITKLTANQAAELLALMGTKIASGNRVYSASVRPWSNLESPSKVLSRSLYGARIYKEAERQFFEQQRMVRTYEANYHKQVKGLSKEEKQQIANFRHRLNAAGERVETPAPLPAKLAAVNTKLTKFVYEPMHQIGVKKGLVSERQHFDDYLPYYRENRNKFPGAGKADQAAIIAEELGIPISAAERIMEEADVKNINFGPFDYSRLAKSVPELRNLDRITEIYVKGFARKVAITDFLAVAQPVRNKIKDEGMRDYAKRYIDQYAGVPEYSASSDWIARHQVSIPGLRDMNLTPARIAGIATSIQFHAKLGFNPFSAILNLTQIQNTAAQFGTLRTLKVLPKGLAAVLLPDRVNPFAREIARLNRSGVLDSQSVKFERAHFAGAFGRKYETAALYLFDKSEQINRATAFLAARDMALAKGASQADAMTAGREGVRVTQFFSGRLDGSLFSRTAAGKPLMQFKGYTLKEIEFVAELPRAGKLRFAAWATAMGGPAALGLLQAFRFFLPDEEITELLEEWQETAHVAAFLGADNMANKFGIYIVPGVDDLGRYNGKERLLSWAAGPSIGSIIDMVQAAAAPGPKTDRGRSKAEKIVAAGLRGFVPSGVEVLRIKRAMEEAETPAEALQIFSGMTVAR